LDHDKIIEIMDQAKAMVSKWYETMVNNSIDTFKMSHEKSVSYFNRLENLENISRIKGIRR
jgi:hypothetical protein